MLKVIVNKIRSEKKIIKCFEESGSSNHSSRADTLGILINYCEENKISYQLTAHPGMGYSLTKMKVDIALLKVGDKVYYQPDHYKKIGKWENGLVKEIPEHTDESVRVVYNCSGDWDNFKNYTGALTNLRDLKLGWRD